MNILITGGAGFIGSHLANQLVDKHNIFIIDDLSTGKESNLDSLKQFEFYKKDICDRGFISSFFKANRIDCVIHLAAIASVFKCVEEPIKSSEVNYWASLNLLEEAAKHKVKQFIFASSAAVYGDEPSLPKTEGSKVQPISGYGIDKFAIEQYLMDYARRKKIMGTAFRFFNVYGPKQDPSSPYSGVLSIFTSAVIEKNVDSIIVYGDGKQSRDFIYIKDLIKAIELSIDNPKMNASIFNLGSGKKTSLLEVISILEEYVGRKINIDYQQERLGDIKHSVSSIEKLKQFGYKVDYSFDAGMKEYFETILK
jgi:UDP-glucose 4-epimerase